MVKTLRPISLSEARLIMGSDAGDMSDKEIQALLDHLNSLARAFVQAVQNGTFSAVFMEYNKSNDV